MSPSPRDEMEQAAKRTLERLSMIRKQFDGAQGSGRVEGKVAVVTGASSELGIGRASVRWLAREGARRVYIMDIALGSMRDFARELEAKHTGLTVVPLEADAADEQAIINVCERAMREEGRLDIFFANAGIVGANMLPTTDPEDFMETSRVNTLSCFLAIKHASEAMKQTGGGSIILTASVAGLRSGAGPIDYSASKAAVINMCQTSANVLAGSGVRVNTICPGLIETGMTTYTFEMARARGTLGKVGQLNPTRRFGIAEEVAPVVGFLASDEASYVNGCVIPVDGGLSSSVPVVPGKAF